MKDIIKKHVTVLVLGVMSLTELIVSGTANSTGILWIGYGLYKLAGG